MIIHIKDNMIMLAELQFCLTAVIRKTLLCWVNIYLCVTMTSNTTGEWGSNVLSVTIKPDTRFHLF